MSDADDKRSGADGWLDDPDNIDVEAPTQALHAVGQPPAYLPPTLPPRPADADETAAGKSLAILAHAGLFLGLPLFIIPMLTRDNAFALHHAKAAAVNYAFLMFTIALTLFTCGLLAPLAVLPAIPAFVGIVHASGGERAGRWGWGDAGESLFANLRPKNSPKQLR